MESSIGQLPPEQDAMTYLRWSLSHQVLHFPSMLYTSWLPVIGLLFWFLFYEAVLRLAHHYGGEWAQTTSWGRQSPREPRARTLCALVHQFIVLVALFIASVVVMRADDWAAFLYGAPGDISDTLLRQIVLAQCGYQSIDLMPGRGLTAGFFAHHMVVFIGAGFILALPKGMGECGAFAVIFELGSGVYNLNFLLETPWTFYPYQVMMPASNAAGLWKTIDFCNRNPDRAIARVVFPILLVALVVMRSIGQFGFAEEQQRKKRLVHQR